MLRALAIRVRGFLVIVAVLAVIGAASTYLFLNYDRLAQSSSSADNPVAGAVVARDEDSVALKDFQSFQQLTADSLKSATEDIAAERAELKNLSDQVSALAARVDAMQGTASISPPQEAAAARPPVIAERKKPPAARPPGRISVGGAPLPVARPDHQ